MLDFCGQLFYASLCGRLHAERRQPVERTPRFVEPSGLFTITRERAHLVVAAFDPLPAQLEWSVEPDDEAVPLCDQCAVLFDSPRAAAERHDDTARIRLYKSTQGARLHLTKLLFTVFIYDLLRGASLPLADELIEVNHATTESPRESGGERSLACGHEARDEDALVEVTHRSRTDARRWKNSGKETPTHSAPSISDSPSAMSAATVKAIAIRWSQRELSRAPLRC